MYVCKLLPEEKAKGHQFFVGDLGVQGVIAIFLLFFPKLVPLGLLGLVFLKIFGGRDDMNNV